MGRIKIIYSMNKVVLLFSIIALSSGSFAQDIKSTTGINNETVITPKGMVFFQGTWAELLKESQKTGKPVFIDAYAAWCGPCRMMASNTFTDEEVGKFYNEHFINYKIDMEKGEGPTLRMKYRVTQYPTYIFVDAQGDLKYRKVGYMVPETFIHEGKKAVESFNPTN